MDPDNLLIELAHIRAAAAEMPLSLDDAGLFPDLGEIIPVLLNAGEVESMAGRFAWAGEVFPAGDYSLRNMDKSRYKLLLEKENREITQMDETQAFHELYPGAVYIHEGELYEVLKLDLESRTAYGVPFSGNYYTVPSGTQETRILQTFREEELGRCRIHFGDINVEEVISMYKKLQFHNHQNLGYVSLLRPLRKDYDTESTWIHIPENVTRVYRNLLVPAKSGELMLNNHFEGLAFAVKNAAMMVTMTESSDIDTVISNNARIPDIFQEEKVSLFIYDRYEGGLGYSEKIYDLVPEILEKAIHMVKGCSCEDGCPACVGDYTLDKAMVLWGLENLLEESLPPEQVKVPEQEARPVMEKEYSFFTLPIQWQEFCQSVKENGEKGGDFLKTIQEVGVEDHTLVLTVKNGFYRDWLLEGENLRELENTLRWHAVCPSDMKIEVRAEEDRENAEKIKGRLRRKYGDKGE